MNVAMRPDLYAAPVQRKATSADTASPAALPSDGGGEAMPEDVQARMETAFGSDFSAVRIHEGTRARALGARAYTQGTDLHFAPGEYQPSSQSGLELLGHELAHVVQQAQGRVRGTTQAKGVDVNDDPGLEAEADALGARAARGEPARNAGEAGQDSQPRPESDALRAVAQHAQAASGGPVQCVRVADLDVDNDEIWDEVAWYLFDVRGCPEEYWDDARRIFDELPEHAEYDYYEDIADELAEALSMELGVSVPQAHHGEEQEESSGGGGWFGTLMKLVVGYLALSSLIPTARAQPVPTSGGSPDPSSNPLICTVDAMGNSICSDPLAVNTLQHVQCESSVMDLCTSVRNNSVYDGLVQEVDKVCDSISIEPPTQKTGACAFSPTSRSIGGTVSCKALHDYDASKIGHELQHAFDHCRVEQSGQKMNPSAWVVSEINAHTTQAAIAKMDDMEGRGIDLRDADLVKNFEAGCPEPTSSTRLDNVSDGLYSIIHMYHERYVKKTLDTKTLVSTYQTHVKRAVARYNDMVSQKSYRLVSDYKKIK